MVKKNNVIKNIILVIVVVALMILIVYLVGRSYGFFRYEKRGETTNVITIKGIRVDIIEDDDALNLLNTEPLYDSDGMQLKAFKFSITNTSKRPLDYTMKVVNDTDKQNACLINEGTANEAACPVLTTDNIRYSYKLNNSNWVEPSNLGQDNDVITTYTINGGETLTYSIKMWIKSDATNDIMNHYFFGQLLIQGTQAAQEMYRPYDVATILSNFNQEDLKEVVACSNDNKYQDCEIYNTIEDAIAAKTKLLIIVTNDITKTANINIATGKDVTLDLNGKNITLKAFVPNGKLSVTDSIGTGKIISTSHTFNLNANANLVLRNIDIESEMAGAWISSGCTERCTIDIYDTTMTTGTKGIGIHASAVDSIINVYGNTIINSEQNAIENNGADSEINIYDGTYVSNTVYSAINSSTGTINLNGGKFISNAYKTICNNTTGTININQTDKPIYISTGATSWQSAIHNNSTGTINITASQADQCTANASDTTSGLCVYTNGDGQAQYENGGGAAVQNISTGVININGGTYHSNVEGITNSGDGIVNIKNVSVSSNRESILINTTGTTNICDSTLNSTLHDLYIKNTGTGTINYNNVTFSNGTTTPDQNKIYNPSGTITEAATCPITE